LPEGLDVLLYLHVLDLREAGDVQVGVEYVGDDGPDVLFVDADLVVVVPAVQRVGKRDQICCTRELLQLIVEVGYLDVGIFDPF